jgi:hypothetical protein
MIIRTSYGEIGHCDKCGTDCNSFDLWEREIEYCRVCEEPLYAADNHGHCIQEEINDTEPGIQKQNIKRIFVVDEPDFPSGILSSTERTIGEKCIPQNSPFAGDGSAWLCVENDMPYYIGQDKNSGEVVKKVIGFIVARRGYYAFDEYGYPFRVQGLANIDSEKALVKVNPSQGYFIDRKKATSSEYPAQKLMRLEDALTVPFGEPSDWLNVDRA